MIHTLLQHIQTEAQQYDVLHLANKNLQAKLSDMVHAAALGDDAACYTFHHVLACLNHQRLSLEVSHTTTGDALLEALCTHMEEQWLAQERARIAPILDALPSAPDAFVRWFERLQETGPGQHHPLFLYLAERASWDEMRYFLKQEMATEAGFDDLLALTQVQTPPQVKMELAHNYWDEMGDGKPAGVHSSQLRRLIESFGLTWDETYSDVHWEPLALSNVMIAFAKARSRFDQAIGALGVIELTAPGRCQKVKDGMKRLGLTAKEYHYYALHSTLDVEHWEGWKTNVIYPLIEADPSRMRGIAEGALLRLLAGSRCFEVYCRHLHLDVDKLGFPNDIAAKPQYEQWLSSSRS